MLWCFSSKWIIRSPYFSEGMAFKLPSPAGDIWWYLCEKVKHPLIVPDFHMAKVCLKKKKRAKQEEQSSVGTYIVLGEGSTIF